MSRTIIVVACALCVLSPVVSRAGDPQIRIAGDATNRYTIEVADLSKEHLDALKNLPPDDAAWTRTLAVYVVDPSSDGAPPPAVLGTYSVTGTGLRFAPRYALRPGVKYRAVLRRADSGNPALREISEEISIPIVLPDEPTRVVAIYPSAFNFAENHLRFYIHFSAPMSAGEAYSRVKLLRADGTPVDRAFLEIGEELWDGSGQRLTLLFDPGRVKKGLQPREEFGPVLEAGQAYRLAIDKAWRDANGQPLDAGFEKRFTAGPAVETAVDSKQWKVSPPAAGTRDPLVVRFSRALDRALLMRMINVATASGKEVLGEITLGNEERRWEFRPDQTWTAGAFNLVIDTTLEDPAGNNLARPFEVDVFEQFDKTTAPEMLRIAFSVAVPGK